MLKQDDTDAPCCQESLSAEAAGVDKFCPLASGKNSTAELTQAAEENFISIMNFPNDTSRIMVPSSGLFLSNTVSVYR